jgi:hypothetical protein
MWTNHEQLRTWPGVQSQLAGHGASIELLQSLEDDVPHLPVPILGRVQCTGDVPVLITGASEWNGLLLSRERRRVVRRRRIAVGMCVGVDFLLGFALRVFK